MELGPESVIDEARRFGISTPIHPYPSIYIGSEGVYPIEMVSAYTAFATLGARSAPMAITRVENAKGDVLWEPAPTVTPVLSPEEAWEMVDMMKDVVQHGTAYGSVWAAGFHLPAAAKTGTTNDYNDVWFIGYTADLVAGVWMGMDKPVKIMHDAQGGRLAGPAWTAFMTEVYRRKPAPPDWPRPEGLVARDIDRTTGMLRNQYCPTSIVYTEWYIPGTEPVEQCTLHSVSDTSVGDTLHMEMPVSGAPPAPIAAAQQPPAPTGGSYPAIAAPNAAPARPGVASPPPSVRATTPPNGEAPPAVGVRVPPNGARPAGRP
jgi:penicillin-binding protein 1A